MGRATTLRIFILVFFSLSSRTPCLIYSRICAMQKACASMGIARLTQQRIAVVFAMAAYRTPTSSVASLRSQEQRYFSTQPSTPSTPATPPNSSNTIATPPSELEPEKRTFWSYLRLRYFIAVFGLYGAYWYLKRTRRQESKDSPNRLYLLPEELDAFAELALLTSEELQACVDASIYVPPQNSSSFNPFLASKKPAPKVNGKGVVVETLEKKVKYLVEKNRRRRNKIRDAVREAEAQIEDQVRLEMALVSTPEGDSSPEAIANVNVSTIVAEPIAEESFVTKEPTYTEKEAATAKFEDWYDDIDSDEAPFHTFEANVLLRPCRTLAPGIVNYYDACAALSLVSADMYDPRDPRDPLYMSPEKLNAPEETLTDSEKSLKAARAAYLKVRSGRFYETRKRLDSHPLERLKTIWEVCTRPKPVVAANNKKPNQVVPELEIPLEQRQMDYTRFLSLLEILLRTGHFDEPVMLQLKSHWPVVFGPTPVEEVASAYYQQLCKPHDTPISLEEFEFAAYQLALKKEKAFWYLDPSKLSTFSDFKLWRMRQALRLRELYRDNFGPKPVVVEVEKVNTPETVKGNKPWSKF